MNRLAVMQPYFFPYPGYFKLIQCTDVFVFLDDVNYINRGWINRNRILINGAASYLTIPCVKPSQNKCIHTIEHNLDDLTRNKLLRKVQHAYSKAPFFDDVFPIIRDVIFSDKKYISDLAIHSVIKTCSYIGIKTRFLKSSDMNLPAVLRGSERILEICRREQAASYYNLPGGRELYDHNQFKESGISLHFLRTDRLTYSQFSGPFVPHLSVIDLMMFNSVNDIMDKLQDISL
jgi:hypothetical protein